MVYILCLVGSSAHLLLGQGIWLWFSLHDHKKSMQICILLIYFMEINMYSEREKNLNLDVLAILRSQAEE